MSKDEQAQCDPHSDATAVRHGYDAEEIIRNSLREIPCSYIPNHKPERLPSMVRQLVRDRARLLARVKRISDIAAGWDE